MPDQLGGVDVSRETVELLEAFAALIVKWNRKINLIAPNTARDIWERHIIDSVQLYRLAPRHYDHWADLGTGGGFPGLVMAILGRVAQPGAHFTMVESDQRKAIFLRSAARELGLSVTVIADRIESIPGLGADVVSARALAPLSALLPLVLRHLASDGLALLPKGRQAAQEIAAAQASWRFDLEDHASFTDPDARILAIRRIKALGT